MNPLPEQLFLLQNQEHVGPFATETLREMLAQGEITSKDYVWAEGMPDWVTAGSLFGTTTEAEKMPVSGSVASRRRVNPAGSQAFGVFVVDAMSYPFRGYGWMTIVAGTIVLTGLDWFKMLPAAPGLLSLFLSLAAWGYLLMMLQSIIQRTAFGKSELPEWPDFEGFGELLGKCFQWFVALLVCFGPAVFLLGKWTPDEGAGMEFWQVGTVILLAVAGAAYFPMAILGVAMFDTVGALNPLLVVRSMMRVAGHYLLTLVIFALLLGLKAVTVSFSDLIPVAGTLLDHFDSLWSSMFLARVLGGLYIINQDKLGWF